MRATFFSLFLAAASVLAAPISPPSTLAIVSPESLSQCTPATFTWTATSAPYYLTIIDPATESILHAEDSIVVVPTANEATWVVDLPAGSHVSLEVRDASGEVARTESLVVGEGSSDCLMRGLVILSDIAVGRNCGPRGFSWSLIREDSVADQRKEGDI